MRVESYTIPTTVPNTVSFFIVTGIQQSDPTLTKLVGYSSAIRGSVYEIYIDVEYLNNGGGVFTAYYLYQ
jgi:hypothetical protein